MSDILADFSASALARAVKSNLYGFFQQLDQGQHAGFPDAPSLTHWRTAIGHPWFNGVIATQPATADAGRLIQGVIDYFRSCGVSIFTWWLDPALSRADWESHLLPRGFFHDDNTPGMAADLRESALLRSAPPGFEIAPVADNETLAAWTRTFVAGYGIPSRWESSLFELMAGLGWPVRNYLGLLDGRPVAASTAFLAAGVVGIYFVATLPEARGRGIGSAMTLAPLRDARELGYCIGVLQSSDMGYSVYQQLGFREVCRIEHFTWSGQAARN